MNVLIIEKERAVGLGQLGKVSLELRPHVPS